MKFIDEIDNTDKFIDDIASDIKMENCTCKIGNEIKYMDICLSSEKANFICTIENKLDAKINTDNKTNKTQLEFYVNHIEKSPYHKKLKIYLCVNSNLREETDNLLKKHGYKTMEYSDVIIMLYKILKKKGKEPDELKFEKEEKIELLEKMINYLAKKGDEKNKKLKQIKKLPK